MLSRRYGNLSGDHMPGGDCRCEASRRGHSGHRSCEVEVLGRVKACGFMDIELA